jgi:long-chain fatty acid transport protein
MFYKRILFFSSLSFYSYSIHASFIEATMGTAVVNDATAIYHNPAAMVLVQHPQLIALGTTALYHSQFSGETQDFGGYRQLGSATAKTQFNLPSAYLAIPVQKSVRIGIAILADKLNSDIDQPSILRYVQSNNRIDNIDYVGSIGYKLNQYFSIGAGASYSSARFISDPIIGFPNIDIPDSQSHNVTKAQQWGWNAGFLINLSKSTLIGFNYRSVVPYQFRGTSFFEGPPAIVSNDYRFNFWTPARSVFTLSHAITPSFRWISTFSFVQWSVFKKVTLQGLATRVNTESLIVPMVTSPYYFHDSWVVTLGGIKNFSPRLIVRLATTYMQSPGNGQYRINDGDSLISGGSLGYTINKNITLDISYAHAFIKNQTINLQSRRIQVTGVNRAYRNSASLKITATFDSVNFTE